MLTFTDKMTLNPTNKLILAGFPSYTFNAIKHFGLENTQVVVLSNKQEDLDKAIHMGYEKVFLWTIDTSDKLLGSIVQEGDLLINTIQDMTVALLINSTVSILQKEIKILQISSNEEDLEVFMHSGATSVISSQQIIAYKLLKEFLEKTHRCPSYLFTNAHLFEYHVNSHSPLKNKKIFKLNKHNIIPLLIKRNNEIISSLKPFMKLKEGDKVVILREKR